MPLGEKKGKENEKNGRRKKKTSKTKQQQKTRKLCESKTDLNAYFVIPFDKMSQKWKKKSKQKDREKENPTNKF